MLPQDSISSLLTTQTVAVGMPGGDKLQVIDQMAALLRSDARVRDIARLGAAVREREAMMSTGVGTGLAIPHARTDAVLSTVAAFAVTSDPVGFEVPDDVPVRLVFLLAGPRADMSRHIRILSRVSRLMQRADFRDRLLAAGSEQEVLSLFEEAESALLAP